MINKLLLLLALLPLTVLGMSMVPDETRELNTPEVSFFVPFSRTNNTPMTFDEYKPVNIYVNDVIYPYALPVVDISDTITTKKSKVIYTFEDVLKIELTLEDLQGNESVRSNPVHMDFTNPSAPIITCVPQ